MADQLLSLELVFMFQLDVIYVYCAVSEVGWVTFQAMLDLKQE